MVIMEYKKDTSTLIKSQLNELISNIKKKCKSHCKPHKQNEKDIDQFILNEWEISVDQIDLTDNRYCDINLFNILPYDSKSKYLVTSEKDNTTCNFRKESCYQGEDTFLKEIIITDSQKRVLKKEEKCLENKKVQSARDVAVKEQEEHFRRLSDKNSYDFSNYDEEKLKIDASSPESDWKNSDKNLCSPPDYDNNTWKSSSESPISFDFLSYEPFSSIYSLEHEGTWSFPNNYLSFNVAHSMVFGVNIQEPFDSVISNNVGGEHFGVNFTPLNYTLKKNNIKDCMKGISMMVSPCPSESVFVSLGLKATNCKTLDLNTMNMLLMSYPLRDLSSFCVNEMSAQKDVTNRYYLESDRNKSIKNKHKIKNSSSKHTRHSKKAFKMLQLKKINKKIQNIKLSSSSQPQLKKVTKRRKKSDSLLKLKAVCYQAFEDLRKKSVTKLGSDEDFADKFLKADSFDKKSSSKGGKNRSGGDKNSNNNNKGNYNNNQRNYNDKRKNDGNKDDERFRRNKKGPGKSDGNGNNGRGKDDKNRNDNNDDEDNEDNDEDKDDSEEDNNKDKDDSQEVKEEVENLTDQSAQCGAAALIPASAATSKNECLNIPNFDREISLVEHSTISLDNICELIGMATSGPSLNLPLELGKQFNICLGQNLHKLSSLSMEQSDEELNCCLCLILSCLMKHLGDCDRTSRESQCTQCMQAFNLIIWHAEICMNAGRQRKALSRSDLCYEICKNLDWDWDQFQLIDIDRLYNKVKKYCIKVLGSAPINCIATVGLSELGTSDGNSSPVAPLSSNTSVSLNGNLITSPTEDISESSGSQGLMAPSGIPRSISMQMPNRFNDTDQKKASLPTTPTSTMSPLNQSLPQSSINAVMPSSNPFPIPGPLFGVISSIDSEQQKEQEVRATKISLTRKPSNRRPVIPQPIPEEAPEPVEQANNAEVTNQAGEHDELAQLIYRRYGSDPYGTQPTYGVSDQAVSMPQGGLHDVEQLMSLCNYRKGEPGIGEVVFGFASQLKIVAAFWASKRQECERTQNVPYQLREEGVILAEFKDKFRILKTRYQKHHQWDRVTYLGNGMSGKCHLAIDIKTEFKFCVKKIHLLRYEEDELRLWSELHHPYIVKIFGAIRHGVKIYIFSEYIDGGSLEACITEQKVIGRRLSHWNAMTYFQQLLRVLSYLQSKNMLHEDIKADNILLRKDNNFIAVTDFGTSRRLHDPKELKNKAPVGSPTHWSPEKACMEGHGFSSDLWAAVCVLVHMLSGEPPWLKRFQTAQILNFIIYAKPPPMEDVASNVQAVVRDLIEKGFVKNPEHRPSASELLAHEAFQMLDYAGPENYYSTLPSNCVPEGSRQDQIKQQENSDTKNKQRSGLASACTSMMESNVLYSTNISSLPCQESDKSKDGREHQFNIRSTLAENDWNSSSNNSEISLNHLNRNLNDLNTNQNNFERLDSSEKLDKKAEITENRGKSDGIESSATDSSSTVEFRSNSQENNSSNMISDHKTLNVENSEISKVSEVLREPPSKINELLNTDLEGLLPNFNALIWSSDSEKSHSIISYLGDNTPTINFNSINKTELSEYKPENMKLDHIPNLSIFNASMLPSHTAATEVISPEISQSRPPLRKLLSNIPFSSESETVDSAEMFGPGPDQNEEMHLSPTSPASKHSEDNSPGHLQQKKPWNFTLNVHKNANDITTKKTPNPQTSSLSSSTPRKNDTSTSSSTGSSQHMFFSPSTGSVHDLQEQSLLELGADFDSIISQSSNDSNKLIDWLEPNVSENEKPVEQEKLFNPQSHNTQNFIDTIQGQLGEPQINGQKLLFYNVKGELLFDVRVHLPQYWKYFIDEIRHGITKNKIKHFTLRHPNNDKIVDFNKIVVNSGNLTVLAMLGAHRDCWCQECEIPNFSRNFAI